MTRKKFITGAGATCKNWTWSWSFVNHANRVVIFGASDVHEKGEEQLILSPEWEFDLKERKKPGYSQALEHIGLVTSERYQLQTFRQVEVLTDDNTGKVKITSFDPVLEERQLVPRGPYWYAIPKHHIEDNSDPMVPEKVFFIEGQKALISSLSVERNTAARAKCIEHHGCFCGICEFDFEKQFGQAGAGFIHVHHLTPLYQSQGPHVVDPINDLMPVCPNCHAIIHRGKFVRSIAEMKEITRKRV